MRIRELMTKHAEWIEASTPLRDVARLLRDRNIGCVPVGENDRLVGMLTAIGSGRREVDDLAVVLASLDRGLAPSPAPPTGLVLWEALYD